MSDWQSPDTALVARFSAALPAGVEPRRMFGCPCAFAQGKMCAGVYGDAVVLRLPEARRTELLAHGGAQPFTVMGRTMREYLLLPADRLADAAALAAAIAEAAAFAVSLPDKPKRAPRKARPAAAK